MDILKSFKEWSKEIDDKYLYGTDKRLYSDTRISRALDNFYEKYELFLQKIGLYDELTRSQYQVLNKSAYFVKDNPEKFPGVKNGSIPDEYKRREGESRVANYNRYYEYLSDQPVIQKDITFLTKAEDISPAVACASIISRYLFLQEFDKLCDSIHIPLPKGAGKDVDEIGEEVVEKYGEEKLQEIAKVNFKNTDRILHTLIY